MLNLFDTWLDDLVKLRKGLGAYEPIPVIEQFLKFFYEDLIVIDAEGRIAFLNRLSEEWFGLPPGGAKGRHVSEFYPNSGLLDVVRTGVPQFGRVQNIRGKERLVTRLPIIKNRHLIGAFGTVVFHGLEGIEKYFDSQLNLTHQHANILDFGNTVQRNTSVYTFPDILGISKSIADIKERAMRIALTNCTVLLSGETGTGKELFAHSIHGSSQRMKGPFVAVNCATIPLELAESELFGYEKGSFTGSNPSGKKGKFELASGGTIFLDEIGAIPLALQPKLLRVIQEKEIQPLGSCESRKVDFRLIAATNVDLFKLTKEKNFRADLYYRLTSAQITISPLRERREDVAYLMKSLLPNINQKLLGNVQSISEGALQLMQDYSWPGNVRELINVLEQSVLNAYPNEEIATSHLPAYLSSASADRLLDEKDIHRVSADAERKAISEALKEAKGNKKKAAEALKISRTGLYYKLRRLNIA